MILQELAGYYQRKIASGGNAIAQEGWVRRPVDYFVVLSEEGHCVDIADNACVEGTRRVAKEELLPSIGKQSLKHTNSGKDANLLWDNAAFALGYGDKGPAKHEHFIAEIDRWFGSVSDKALTALRSFLGAMQENGALTDLLKRHHLYDDFQKREPVIAFRWQPDGGVAIHHRPALLAHYEEQRLLPRERSLLGTCLVSGDVNVPLALNETVIKGVRAAQTSGANLVSFNKRAFESYGKRERAGENSPIGVRASFAYNTALNHLLRSASPQKIQVADTTTVFWANRNNDFEKEFAALFDEPTQDDPDSGTRAVAALNTALQQGVEQHFDNQSRFFVLGIAPNKARLAIRSWHTGTLAEMAQRIARHFDDIKIDLPRHTQKQPPFLSIGLMLRSVSTPSSKWPDGDPETVPPNLGGEVMRAILEGLPYPETLFHGTIRRIRTGGAVTFPRAGVLKACLNRKPNPMEDKIQMSLDLVNANAGYRLGRLFAVLERIQEEAAGGHGKPNATIRDRFYGAASSTPATVFPMLLRLKNHHLSKIDNVGRRKNLESLLGEIIDGLPPRFEPHLSMDNQGRFAVGYYHQRMHPSTYGKAGD